MVLPSLLVWRATRIVRRSENLRRRRLEADLAAFVTHADQLELQAILSRYPDPQTDELRRLMPAPGSDPRGSDPRRPRRRCAGLG
ncbi:hypothetical protein ACPPVT_05030 [Angustibacter sp. McL0619]|uniref:hypothetical protein n=1 Tax=Angustibacter sp. McL0619 TaxID=3415676 RepID=UPI003CF99124